MRGREGSTEFGNYRLVRRMAVGGFSDIFLAQRFGPAGYERTFVLKRLRGDLSDNPRFVQQVLDESRILPFLDHENVVRTVEAGELEGTPFLVMEFIFGRTLRQVLDRCASEDVRMPLPHVRCVMADVLDALEYAHEHAREESGRALRVVHRDVCPSNIVLGFDGLVRLIDFGVAKSDIQTSRTRVGMVKGRLAYMSPEQVRRGALDGRSDLFALGCVLWEALVGRRLFDRPNELDTMRAVLSYPVPRQPRGGDAEVRRLGGVARRALFRRRWMRFGSARAMRKAVVFGDGRSREEARDELEAWLGAVFARELERRDFALRKALGNPREFRMLRDSGFELLPEVTGPLGRVHSSMPRGTEKTRSIRRLSSRRSLWAGAAVFALASVGLGAFLARLDRAPKPRSGVLFVASDRPCEVMLGGRRLGWTPVFGVEVPLGSYQLKCRGGGPADSAEIVIREGQSRFMRLDGRSGGDE